MRFFFVFFKSWRYSHGRTETMDRWEGSVDLSAGYSTPCCLYEKSWSGVLWWGGAEQSCEDHQRSYSHSHNVHVGTHSAELYGKLRVNSRWDENTNNVSPFFFTFIGPCIVIYFYSKINKMHQFLKFILFCSSTQHVSGSLSVYHQESKTVHTVLGICQTDSADCLLAGTRWNSVLSLQQNLFDICCMYSLRLLADCLLAGMRWSSVPSHSH